MCKNCDNKGKKRSPFVAKENENLKCNQCGRRNETVKRTGESSGSGKEKLCSDCRAKAKKE